MILPNAAIVDGFGSSETGAQGSQRAEAGTPPPEGVTAFKPYGETTKVLDELTKEPVEPGSDVIGRVALRGRIPQGYYNDPVKTAETFVEAEGHRWVLTGDMATVAADGTITLLGRGSQCINSGGEKIFPEEVEEAVKRVPGVIDCLVVGVDDERFGQAVNAVVSTEIGAVLDEPSIIAGVKEQLAGYKAPKRVVFVDEVPRAPNGKGDYPTAKRYALEGAGG